jgi:hypothetical protein
MHRVQIKILIIHLLINPDEKKLAIAASFFSLMYLWLMTKYACKEIYMSLTIDLYAKILTNPSPIPEKFVTMMDVIFKNFNCRS